MRRPRKPVPLCMLALGMKSYTHGLLVKRIVHFSGATGKAFLRYTTGWVDLISRNRAIPMNCMAVEPWDYVHSICLSQDLAAL